MNDKNYCHVCHKCHKCNKYNNCNRLLYSIGAWADNRVTQIKFIPLSGSPILWSTTNNTLNVSSPTNTNHWNMQSPITSIQFPIFPLQIDNGDKIEFTFNNDPNTLNAFACAANINGKIYRTFNNTILGTNKINLQPSSGFTIVNPSYSPTTDLITRNIVDTVNYISLVPNNTNFVLTWNL